MYEHLRHYGTPRHSGRYPWGSGEDPYQSEPSLSAVVDGYKRKGFTEKEISQAIGMSIADIRAQKSIERLEKRAADVAMAQKLLDKGMSVNAIAKRMNKNESSVRALLDSTLRDRANITTNTVNALRDSVNKGRYIDIGSGVEHHLGITENRLKTAIKALKNEGYEDVKIQVDQLGTDKKTTVRVLAPPGTTYRDVVTNIDNIQLPFARSENGGRSYLGLEKPVSIDSKRIQVVYAEDGGSEKDGLIELRRGAEDLSLGGASYAQARIKVDKDLYMKGMAIYSDDLPPGVDIRFNTNKKRGTPLSDTLKPIKKDKDNPFGSSVVQLHYTDGEGKKRLSAVNIVGSDKSANKEGIWATWGRNLSSQIMAKQPIAIAKAQLQAVIDNKTAEYEMISELTNPVIKKHLLQKFSDSCDADAVHLQAAALPRQMNHVILPVPSMPDTQVYAPNYRNGETVVLIRHPHGGRFEIPELTVNNKHAAARKMIGQAVDAVGISPATAQKLSGADFDGDHVIVIPNPPGKNKLQIADSLAGLKDFDPIGRYPEVPGMKVMGEKKGGNTGVIMGQVSNLITDMTLKGANPSEITRAVSHSMVVIDAEKHRLNYKQSEIDFGIRSLKEKYQGGRNSGASTLISRAGAEARVPERKEGQIRDGKRVYIDPKTGEKLYTETGNTYINKKGKEVPYTTKTTKMDVVKDAHELSSGTSMERVYADHANQLKALANKARKDTLRVKRLEYSPAAKKEYAREVASLKEKLHSIEANRPLERRAQIIANTVYNSKLAANKGMSAEEKQKIKSQALDEARRRVGAKNPKVIITPKEWQAIQKGAISHDFLESLLTKADLDEVRALATPRKSTSVSNAAAARARAMARQGYSLSEIADQLGVSVSTLRIAMGD